MTEKNIKQFLLRLPKQEMNIVEKIAKRKTISKNYAIRLAIQNYFTGAKIGVKEKDGKKTGTGRR